MSLSHMTSVVSTIAFQEQAWLITRYPLELSIIHRSLFTDYTSSHKSSLLKVNLVTSANAKRYGP